MIWRGLPVQEMFHASEDKQVVRDEVYEYIAAQDDIRIDVTVLEKAKAQPQTRATKERFYKTAWYFTSSTWVRTCCAGTPRPKLWPLRLAPKKGKRFSRLL